MKLRLVHFFLMLLDSLIVLVVPFLAVALRFEGELPDQYVGILVRNAPFIVLVRLAVFYAMGVYSRLWRYAGMREWLIIAAAVTVSSFFLTASQLLIDAGLPASIHILSWLLNILLVGGSRFVIRLYAHYVRHYRNLNPFKAPRNVLIVGAGDAGALIAWELLNLPQQPYRLVGFIDDDPEKHGNYLYGAKVLGGREQIPTAVMQLAVEQIVIAMSAVEGRTIRDLVRICHGTKCEIRIAPDVYELDEGRVAVHQLRPVQVEDLLRRPPVQLDMDGIGSYLAGKRVLVTGAGGSIGSELCRQIARLGPQQLILLGKGENSIYEIDQELRFKYPQIKTVSVIGDVRDAGSVDTLFGRYRPQVVFHAAAHKHVPLMESYPTEAVKNNIFGTKNVAEAAARHESETFIMISTDKAVNPTSVMGATKRVAEMIIQNMNGKSRTRYAAVRFGNVLGSRGSVIPLFKKQIAWGGPVTVTDPGMTRYFMTIPEASQLVLQAGVLASSGEVFVLDMGQPVKILTMAEDLIRLSGLEPYKDIDIQFCGLRPGEKLYEELLTAEEGTKATKYEKIFVAALQQVDGRYLSQQLERLRQESDNARLIALLQELVPNFSHGPESKQLCVAVGAKEG